jgi:CelD/BcsL family acetyltransferase involved in cellulose biosynthesis
VFAWKSDQCRRTGVFDFFQLSWTRELVARILSEDTPHFAGRLSALYAGDQLLAAHMGMRSERVWHWWFPVYDQAAGKYSPGGILLLRVAEAAAAEGALALDLGKGDDPYKQSFADSDAPIGSRGPASAPRANGALRAHFAAHAAPAAGTANHQAMGTARFFVTE